MQVLEKEIDDTLLESKLTGKYISIGCIQDWLERIAVVGHKKSPWILERINHLIKINFMRLSPAYIEKLLHAMQVTRYADKALFVEICCRLRADCAFMNTDQLINSLHSLSAMRYYDPGTFEALCEEIATRELHNCKQVVKLWKSMALINVVNDLLIKRLQVIVDEFVNGVTYDPANFNQFRIFSDQAVAIMWSCLVLNVECDWSRLLTYVKGPMNFGYKNMLHHIYLAKNGSSYVINEGNTDRIEPNIVKLNIRKPNFKPHHKANPQPSEWQLEIDRGLMSLGYRIKSEAIIRGISVDTMVFGRPHIAVEFNGPSHYLFNSGIPTGKTMLKQRLLEMNGVRVVTIPWFEWPCTSDEQLEYLRSRLGI